MSMALTPDERRYFDEKFNNINQKFDDIKDDFRDMKTSIKTNTTNIQTLKVEMEKRPTIIQMIAACGFFLVLGITLGAALF